LRERHGVEGQKLAVGAALAVFDTNEAEEPEPQPPAKAEMAARKAVHQSQARSLAAPAVRARAEALGITLSAIPDSGPDGRILHGDLDRHLLARPGAPPKAAEDQPADFDEVQIFGLRRRIAERMQESMRRIPHFTYVEEVAVDELEQERARRNSTAGTAHLTLLPFLIRGLVRAIASHPEVNCHFDDERGTLRRFHAVHVGIATQTERGLLVPVIRNAQDKDLFELASEIQHLSSAARAGKSAREDLTGSTITVTSLGALGGIMATPIINPPEVAIIGINRIRETLVLEGREVGARKVMNLSSSFDHRIVDGFVAAAFIASLREALETPSQV
jgi:2-oxoisovalerate dehydrogenase E2 component (dihydrolipoyl transacylase)